MELGSANDLRFLEMGHVLRQILTTPWILRSLRKVLWVQPTYQRAQTKRAHELCASSMGSPGLCGNAGGELFAATRIPARFASPFATCVCHEDAVDRIASQHCASNNQSGMSATDLQRASRWVDDHGECLYRYALVRVRKPEVAEDLVQETFLAAVRGFEKFGGRSSERSWLVGILKNKIVDHFRKVGQETSFTDMEFLSDEFSEKFVPIGFI
jgi:Sigma-70 region 2